jgi:hypothetical protein
LWGSPLALGRCDDLVQGRTEVLVEIHLSVERDAEFLEDLRRGSPEPFEKGLIDRRTGSNPGPGSLDVG